MTKNVSTGTVLIEDLGGITRADVALEPGVTVLTGPNASNKTSFLRSVSAALGGSGPLPRSDADSGHVRLDLGGQQYTREFERRRGDVVAGGTPFLTDEQLVDTFVTLLASNPIRRAVEQGGDLRDLLMAPVDEATIRAEIDRVETERSAVDEELRAIRDAADRLPTLTDRRDELETKLEEIEGELESLEDSLDDDTPIGTDTGDNDTAETLESARQDLNETRDRIERERNSLEALREERRNVDGELDAVGVDEGEIERLNERLEQLESRSRRLDDLVSDLSTIVNFNERVVEDDTLEALGVVDEDPTDALDPASRELECWTCGSTVVQQAVTERLDSVRELIEEKRSERSELNEEIRELRSERAALEEAAERRRTLEARRDEIDAEIERRERRLESLESEAADCRERIEAAETALAANDDADEEALELRERFSDLEYERGRIEGELADVRTEINEIEADLDRQEELRNQRGELTDELSSLRSRIEDLEREVVETFNEHAQTLLDRLDYENVERIRLERVVEETTGRGGSDNRASFEMYLTRTDEAGRAVGGSVQTLSESERTVVGLTAALAGYLTHDIHETVPVLLLDSLDAVDAERIGPLIEYLADFVDYLIVALLPGDAETVAEDYRILPSSEL